MAATSSEMRNLQAAVREDAAAVLHTPQAYKPEKALGIFRHSVLPSLGLQGGLSLITYGLARATNRVDLKDWLWPTGMVLNAWWTAVGQHTLLPPHHSTGQILRSLSFPQKALLGAVTAWGGRLAFRVISRSIRRGKDDHRYEAVKQQEGFWDKASLLFGLEAVFQTLISIPFTSAFRTDSLASTFYGAPYEWAGPIRWTAAGLFTAGLFLETLADWQLDFHKDRETVKKEQGGSGELLRSGVWSIVRHPNYLGDALIHLSFPLWAYGSGLFSYLHLVSPAANYFFLRYIGGDRENEASQVERYAKEDREKHSQMELYQLQKNSFWPGLFELANPWTWVVGAAGAIGAYAEFWAEWKIGEAAFAANPVSMKVGEEVASLV